MTERMTMSADRLAAAANLRRQAAEQERHDRGDIAFERVRRAAPLGPGRRGLPTPRELRAVTEVRGGKELVHTSGYFTRYNRYYPMWDSFGEYKERVKSGAGRVTLAAKPEVAFLTNHGGMAMARTTTGTLELLEHPEGGWHDGWLNPKRTDVSDLVIAIEDGDVPQMSFAFMIPDGGGEWTADFESFDISRYDINGGDVSACNYGANPYTDISARQRDVLDDIGRLPQGALMEARERIELRSDPLAPVAAGVVHDAREPEESDGRMVRRLKGRYARTAARLVDYATEAGLTVRDLATVRAPWYEIRAGEPVPYREADDEGPVGDATDIYIFDEIGGSFGVTAKSFIKALNEVDTPRINLHINSPGGSVTEAMAIHSAELHHPAWIESFVDGIAASAASIIALGADKVTTMPGAQWMLHDASTTIDGNEADLEKAARWIGKQSNNVAAIYAARLGVTVEEARAIMIEELWSFAEESVTLGLADRIGGRNQVKAPPAGLAKRMARQHDLTRFGYRYLSREAAPPPMLMRDQVRADMLGKPVAGDQGRPGGAVRSASVSARPSGSTPDQPRGRSIALIEAQLDVAENE